jgi:hypothetical protein
MLIILLVFLALARYKVVKIARSSSEVVLLTTKHMEICPGLDPTLEVVAICPAVWYGRWAGVTRGEWRAREDCVVKGEMDLVPPAWRIGVLL